MKSGIGFTMALLGLGGLSEAYGNVFQITISATLIVVGGILIYEGIGNEKKNNERSHSDSNVLDRLYFLR